MSVIVRGMEMPDCCGHCPFRIKANPDENICRASGELFEETLGILTKWRHSSCPLVDIPTPHGDLIDRNNLGATDFELIMCNGNFEELARMLVEKIEKAPTVIEEET